MTRWFVLIISLTLAGCREAPAPEAPPAAEAPTATAPAANPSGRLPGAAAKLIDLPAGSSSTAVEGRLAPDRHNEFVIGGRRDSLLLAEVVAPGSLRLNVYRMDTGELLADDDARESAWKGHLPATVGYLLEVEGASSETKYSLKLDMPSILPPRPPAITDLQKGLTITQAEAILGKPTSAARAQGSQLVVEREYVLNGQKITARYVGGVLINYTTTVKP